MHLHGFHDPNLGVHLDAIADLDQAGDEVSGDRGGDLAWHVEWLGLWFKTPERSMPPLSVQAGHAQVAGAPGQAGFWWRGTGVKKREPEGSLASESEEAEKNSSRYVFVAWIAQHVATSPDRLDVVLATGRRLQFLAQLADEDVNDFEF